MDTTNAKQEFLLTKKELARRLRVSGRKIELDELMPKIKWGRNVRYCWEDVLAYLREQNG